MAFTAVIAFWLQGYINDYADVSADRFSKLQHFLLPTLQRVVLPLSMVFLILPGRMVIERFYSDPLLLDAALPLLLSLALVRMLVYLIIKAFRPGATA